MAGRAKEFKIQKKENQVPKWPKRCMKKPKGRLSKGLKNLRTNGYQNKKC
jgi:hypothetical protein